MASQPPQPPESIVIGQFTGVKNVVSEERLKQGELSAAVNVDIDDAAQLRRRRGYRLLDNHRHHSLKRIAGQLVVVREGMLGILDDSFDFTPMVQVGPDALAYTSVGSTIYFSSRTTSGKLVDGAALPWGTPGADRWLSPVLQPTETLGAVAGKLLGAPPQASVLEHYKGRIYLGSGRWVWATELYLYDLVDKTRNFLQFEGDVTMIAAVSDGLYVGTVDQLMFLQGTFSAGLKITELLSEGVVPGSLVQVPYSKAMPQARGGQPVPEGYGPMFLTNAGVVLGMDGGQAFNLTQDHFVFPSARRAAALYREDQGANSYVAVADSAGGPVANARIGDYVDAQIIRASQRG